MLEVADAHSEMPSQQRLQALQGQLRASGIGVEVLQLQAAPKSILKILKVCKSTTAYPVSLPSKSEGIPRHYFDWPAFGRLSSSKKYDAPWDLPPCMRYIVVALSTLTPLQDGEGEKQKSYLAKCRLPCPVTDAMLEQLAAMKDIVLKQTTPTRVEQRRAMLVRHPYPQLTALAIFMPSSNRQSSSESGVQTNCNRGRHDRACCGCCIFKVC